MQLLFIFKIYLLTIIIGYNCYIFLQTTQAENLNYKINIDQRINQLHHISNAHSEYLIHIQQELAENQRNIDILRDHIQNIEHHIEGIKNDQKKSWDKLNEIIRTYNRINIPSLNQSSDIESITSNAHTPQIITHDTTTKINDTVAYKNAVSLVLEKKQYNQAILTFQNFIKDYPNSDYQPNAHYWLGQLYYNKNNKDKASYYFALVTKNYPKSSKAPDALLKIGIIMQETNQKDKAKIIYRQVNKLYPKNDAAKQAQKRLAQLCL